MQLLRFPQVVFCCALYCTLLYSAVLSLALSLHSVCALSS